MVDDMRADDLRFMPATRRLIGGAGVTFRNGLSPYPLCCPARASVLTGLYTHNHGVFQTKRPYGFTSFDDDSTLATWLDEAGYTTAYLGKYLNGYGEMPEPGKKRGRSVSYVPPGWDRWWGSIDGGLPAGHPKAGGTYEYQNTTVSRNGQGWVNFRGEYQTRVYGRIASRWVERYAADEAPYFLYLSFTAPHSGYAAVREPDDPWPIVRDDGELTDFVTPARPRDVWGRFDEEIARSPGEDWADPDPSDKPAYLTDRPPLNEAERAAMLEVTRQRAESLWVVDREVRRLVRSLRASGELRNTVVLFTSDNGYFLGEQWRRQGKVYPHEPSLRVPLLMRGPGIPAGEVRDDPFTSIDVAPTFAEFAGIATPPRRDGISLVEVARSGDAGWERPILTETGNTTDSRRFRSLLGVRTERYLYVDSAAEIELYDVRRDPEQYVNLASDPRFADVRRRLARVLDQLQDCRGEACQQPLPPSLR